MAGVTASVARHHRREEHLCGPTISFGSLLGPTEFMAKGVRVLELPEDPRGGHALTSGHLLSAPPGCPFWVPGFTLVTEGRGTCTTRRSSDGGAGRGEVGGPQGYGLAHLCAGCFVLWRAGQGRLLRVATPSPGVPPQVVPGEPRCLVSRETSFNMFVNHD